MRTFEKAIKENTRALRDNTDALRRLAADQDKEAARDRRRADLLSGVPYSEERLLELKRQDLVMLAARLGVKNTSVPQARLVAAVLEAQRASK